LTARTLANPPAVLVAARDLERVPQRGAALALVDERPSAQALRALDSALARVREDVLYVVAEGPLALESGLPCERLLHLGAPGTSLAQRRALVRAALAWLRGDRLLVLFPGAARGRATSWRPSLARWLRRAAAPVFPICLRRTAPGARWELRAGLASSARHLAELPSEQAVIGHLRFRARLLAHRSDAPLVRTRAEHAPIAAAPEPRRLACEIEALPKERDLVQQGAWSVLQLRACDAPEVLREIGRLREITFRGAGEGSGAALDLDAFDATYDHLVLWNRERREVGGSYRLARTQDVLEESGLEGLYTHTLFEYDPLFFERLGPAIELGRSFVRAEHQRSFAPLLLLWRAIGAYVLQRPRCATLFGAVSISNDYSPLSRSLMVAALRDGGSSAELASLARPRAPLRARRTRGGRMRLGGVRLGPDVEELSNVIADLESDEKGVPVLLREYLKLGGRVLDFNVDRAFSSVLDALVIVDLRRTPERVLARYLGAQGAARLRAEHVARPAV
jgi:putative hemolysin